MNKLFIQELANKTKGSRNNNNSQDIPYNKGDRNNNKYRRSNTRNLSNKSFTLDELAEKKMNHTSSKSSESKSRDRVSSNNIRMTENDEAMVNDIIDGSRVNNSRIGRSYGGYRSSNNRAGRRSSAASAGYKFHNRPYSHNDFTRDSKNKDNEFNMRENRRVNSSVRTGNIDSLSEIVNKTLGKR